MQIKELLVARHLDLLLTYTPEHNTIGFSANIADMGIPFQIICNCYTKVFDIIHIFENCTF